ncbi:MAG TPA: LapA family protein [Xanthobacteraceae bacterium]
MNGARRSGGRVVRNLIAALILVPLAIIIIAFAVANRQIVTVSLDPFSAEHPAASVALPLFGLIIVFLIVGVLIGGIAAWLRQARWRRTARRLEREAGALRGEIEEFKRTVGMVGGGGVPQRAEPPERLQLQAPRR